jgi:hypothetical protein
MLISFIELSRVESGLSGGGLSVAEAPLSQVHK